MLLYVPPLILPQESILAQYQKICKIRFYKTFFEKC